MTIKADEISKIIREQIGSFAVAVDVAEVGTVVSLGDGIARVHGCQRAMAGEQLANVVLGSVIRADPSKAGARGLWFALTGEPSGEFRVGCPEYVTGPGGLGGCALSRAIRGPFGCIRTRP